ncbi:hypothetical protein PMI42_07739 [Bradyrhizobium sp. YR681]|nr:hypothetical protein PMI42_07739 [Bradyrhizobium sp. YR681]
MGSRGGRNCPHFHTKRAPTEAALLLLAAKFYLQGGAANVRDPVESRTALFKNPKRQTIFHHPIWKVGVLCSVLKTLKRARLIARECRREQYP